MKVYQDLILRGNRQALDSFIAELDRHLTDGWTRKHAREAEVSKEAFGKMYCFACTAKVDRPACELWVATHSDGGLYVSNILADELSSLTYDQYNDILANFNEACIGPAAKASGVAVELGKPDPQLDDFLSDGTAAMLRSFSRLANRSILHPLDEKRWKEFLVSAHREEATLDGPMLRRWLTEEERWPEDQAIRLANEYEQARALLELYESQPA
jgi:hypothetical protein